jgi:hypothetical protein
MGAGEDLWNGGELGAEEVVVCCSRAMCDVMARSAEADELLVGGSYIAFQIVRLLNNEQLLTLFILFQRTKTSWSH